MIMDEVIKEVKVEIGTIGVKFLEEEREWRLPGLFYTDDWIFCGASEEDLKVIVGCFGEVFRRKGLKVHADKIKVMVLGGEEGLECEVCVDGARLEQVSEFKYLRCVFYESRTYDAECRMKVASGRKVEGVIRSLMMQVLYTKGCSCLFDCMAVKEKENSRIRALQMYNLKRFYRY